VPIFVIGQEEAISKREHVGEPFVLPSCPSWWMSLFL